MTIDQIDTPAVIIDEPIALHNIEAFQAYCTEHGLNLRPHIKTHKLPYFAKKQVEAGAIGITCQKLSEADIMADAGIEDILITFNIVGDIKLNRLQALSKRVSKLSVTADNLPTIEGLARTFEGEQTPLSVLVECDTGAGRCGVQTSTELLLLAQAISASKGLDFAGIMTYPNPEKPEQLALFIAEAKKTLSDAGIACNIVSSGGSPTMWEAASTPGVTEYRIGTYIYNDRSLIARDTCTPAQCALTVLATVVSKPTKRRLVIDAGSKTLTSDLFGLQHFGQVVGFPDLRIANLSEEHGVIDCMDSNDFQIGQKIQIIPNHACVVTNMVDYVWLKNAAGEFTQTPVAARGGIT